jgi:hypothetical protein
MGIPKRKNDIQVYNSNSGINETNVKGRRKELLERITKSDTFLPDSILHEDLDLGMLNFITENFKIVSDGEEIPIIPKILTVQRWGEISNNWSFSDESGNIKLPFIGVIRKPDVQFGTNPSIHRTIPDRRQFFYASVPTWNGTQMGADVYKIPQPIAVDISFEVTVICYKLRDINLFNKKILQKFSSRQSYTTVKGHYIPIILERIEDSSPMDSLDNRRFYIQNYSFLMLGFLIDDEEFEVKPAISRLFLLNEFIQSNNYIKKYVTKTIEVTIMSFPADGVQTFFSVGETINVLFTVTINGLVQTRDIDYFHVSQTSKITFVEPPMEGSTITITYFKGKNDTFINTFGKPLNVYYQNFIYDGSSLEFTTTSSIDSVISLDINGLIEEESVGYEVSGDYKVKLLGTPIVGSKIGVVYLS